MRPSSTIASKEQEFDEDVLECAWEFILEEHDALKRLCKLMSRGDAVLAEDMMSDVVPVYVPKAIACWDPTKSPLRGHVMRSLKMYCWKSANYRFAPGESSLYGDAGEESDGRDESEEVGKIALDKHRTHTPRLDLNDECGYILARLDAYDRSLLTMYFLCGLTHEEIGGVLEVSKGTAREHHKKALRRAQEIAGRLYDSDGECFDPDAFARRIANTDDRGAVSQGPSDDDGVCDLPDTE